MAPSQHFPHVKICVKHCECVCSIDKHHINLDQSIDWCNILIFFTISRNAAQREVESAGTRLPEPARGMRGAGGHAWTMWWWIQKEQRPWGTPEKHGMMGGCPQRRRSANSAWEHTHTHTPTVWRSFLTNTEKSNSRVLYVLKCSCSACQHNS